MAKEPNWTEAEDSLLKLHYALADKAFLCSLFPSRRWSSIKQHAYGKLGLKKEVTGRTKNGNVDKLLEETPEAYYWMGFLLADGSFDSLGRISVSLSELDLPHLEAYASFISSPKIHKQVRSTNFKENGVTYKVTCYSAYYGKLLKAKFNLLSNKTENPPDLKNVFTATSADNALALILGFFDGDGYIGYANNKKNNFIKLEIHKSWLDNLKLMEQTLYQYFNEVSPMSAKINTKGYASLTITRTSILQKLKAKANLLPALERKWIKIQ